MPHQSRRSAQSHPRGGFSLVELLLVLVVMGCVGALTWPRLESWRDSLELDRATERVRATLQEARRLSVELGVPVMFEHRSSGRETRIRSLGDSSQEVVSALPEGISLDIVTAGRQTKDWTTITTFRPDGSATANGLVIRDARGAIRQLSVDRATGAVSQRETDVFRQED